MSKTFYFIDMEYIDFPTGGFSTSQQMTIPETKKNADPISTLKIVKDNYYRGWTRLEGCHETVDKTPRRLAGDPEYLFQSIYGGDKPFDCFYNPHSKKMIMNTSKHNVIGIQRRLIRDFPNIFKPKNTELDFEHLLKELQHTQIVSSWFNNIQGKVNAVGLFGKRVNLDEVFNHYSEIGKISAISVEWKIADEDQPINVMFTKSFGVVLQTNWDLAKDLDFLFGLEPILFKAGEIHSVV